MTTQSLSDALTRDVLAYLHVEAAAPDIHLLDQLVHAYVRTVPWESASRIAKRARTVNTADCPRWADEFWQSAIEHGTGGSCFESNYAFASLLGALSYEGSLSLTLNNMNETVGCHTAIIVTLDDARWLVDVGLPIHAPLPLRDEPTQRESVFHTYTVAPLGDHQYTIERDRHPRRYCFTLIDQPVSDANYRTAATADYGEHGLFLDKVVINKVINEQLWRFNSDEPPPHLQRFEGDQRIDTPIEGDVAARLASHFGIDEAIVQAALEAVEHD